jgi:hypothetical protein
MQIPGNLSQAPAICIQFHRLPSNAFGVALFFGFGRVLTITVHTTITLHACFRRPRFVLAGCLLAIWTRCHGSLSPLFWTFSFLGLSSTHSFGHLADLLGHTDIFSRNAIKCQEGNFPVCNCFHMEMGIKKQATISDRLSVAIGTCYWQPGYWKEPIRVCQLLLVVS